MVVVVVVAAVVVASHTHLFTGEESHREKH